MELSSNRKKLFYGVRNHEFNDSSCFLCGTAVEADGKSKDSAKTKEHVFPEWLLETYDLWNEALNLLNGTPLLYRQLMIPCCHECNTIHLSQVENVVRTAILAGPEAVEQLISEDPWKVYVWLGKIYFGIHYKEILLPHSRRDPGLGSIRSPEMMRDYESLHLFLQSARIPFSCIGVPPGSFFVFQVQDDLPSAKDKFDYMDEMFPMVLALRIGEVGILADLGWGGLELELHTKFRNLKLHPLQFRELVARYFYSAGTRINPGIVYQYCEERKADGSPGIVAISQNKPAIVLGEFKFEEYANLLAGYWDCPLEHIFVPPNLVRTILTNPQGEPLFIDFQSLPALQWSQYT